MGELPEDCSVNKKRWVTLGTVPGTESAVVFFILLLHLSWALKYRDDRGTEMWEGLPGTAEAWASPQARWRREQVKGAAD